MPRLRNVIPAGILKRVNARAPEAVARFSEFCNYREKTEFYT